MKQNLKLLFRKRVKSITRKSLKASLMSSTFRISSMKADTRSSMEAVDAITTSTHHFTDVTTFTRKKNTASKFTTSTGPSLKLQSLPFIEIALCSRSSLHLYDVARACRDPWLSCFYRLDACGRLSFVLILNQKVEVALKNVKNDSIVMAVKRF